MARQKSSRPNSPKKAKKSAKMPNQNFQGQTPSKKAKFDLFGLTQGQMATLPRARERLTCNFLLRHHIQNGVNSNDGIEYRTNSEFST